MRHTTSIAAFVTMALFAACSSSDGGGKGEGGTASLSVKGSTYRVRDVKLHMETGESAWFRIDGDPVENAGKDCVPGLGGGLGLYGDLPSSVAKPLDLIGKRLRVDFTGDGDDANFCFVGMGGLAGAEDAWVTIESVTGDRVTFSMSGTFKVYDENGEGPVTPATATGTAVVQASS